MLAPIGSYDGLGRQALDDVLEKPFSAVSAVSEERRRKHVVGEVSNALTAPDFINAQWVHTYQGAS